MSGMGRSNPELAKSKLVVLLEDKDARDLTDADIPEKVDGIVADVSFISLRLVLDPTLRFVRSGGWLIALVKPQFEVGRGKVGKGGIVRDEAAQKEVLAGTARWLLAEHGWRVVGTMESPITGGDGNREYLLAATKA